MPKNDFPGKVTKSNVFGRFLERSNSLMIAFDLECSQGHVFEAWFRNASSFEEQNAGNLVSCPFCHDTNVRILISPVAMKTSSRTDQAQNLEFADHSGLADEILDYIHKHFQDVGPDFTNEALKMHFGVAEKRNIKGSATADEEKLLKDEGVEFFKFPVSKIVDEKKN
jgi:hypothetical protein